MSKRECRNKIDLEKVLAVEGKDEYNFFDVLLKTLSINNVQIIDVGGKDKFKKILSVYLQTERALVRIKSIGFVRDAENQEAAAAFQSICSILRDFGLPSPTEPLKVIEQNGKKVSIFIMPNNNDCGMLEDLCLASIQGTDVYGCVKCFVNSYEDKIEKEKYNEAKAKILAYLSTRVPVVQSIGIAAKQNVWDFSNPCFNDIKKFLKELFE